jgi:hypothetical protein
MLIRSIVATGGLALALISAIGTSAFALELEENIYADMQAAEQARVTTAETTQDEARNTSDAATRSDANAGSSGPALSREPSIYDGLTASHSIPAGE